MIDNHTHLDLIDDKLENIINRAKSVGVTEFIVPGILGFPKKLDELKIFKEVKICWGIYPEYANNQDLISREIENFHNSRINIFAIGECGLDKRFDYLEDQIKLFKKQIDIAKNHNLPVIVHIVGYWQKAFEILKETKPNFLLHSWNGSNEMAKEFLKIGGKFSLSASALRNTQKLTEFLRVIPKDKIIYETDSPDQKPNFATTKQNEPANLPAIKEAILRFI